MHHARSRHQRCTFYRVLVTALCATYGSFFFLSSLCLATGLFHSHDASDTHRHSHETNHTSTIFDLCDFTLQMLSTSDLEALELPVSEPTFYKTAVEVPSIPPFTPQQSPPAIRAPPVALS